MKLRNHLKIVQKYLQLVKSNFIRGYLFFCRRLVGQWSILKRFLRFHFFRSYEIHCQYKREMNLLTDALYCAPVGARNPEF